MKVRVKIMKWKRAQHILRRQRNPVCLDSEGRRQQGVGKGELGRGQIIQSLKGHIRMSNSALSKIGNH